MLRRVLIVDDNAINRRILKGVLSSDYDVWEAENGPDALEMMDRIHDRLSAVLLDIVMPGMDGYAVLRRMRESTALAQIPVIMVTGSEDENSRVKALALGANDFVVKPYNPDIIKHCLRNNIALWETSSLVNAIQRDKLTGIYNGEFFFDKAAEMIKSKEPGYYILACFDIDNFKFVNDQLGTAEGDRILKHIGAAIKSLFHSVGGIAGRISGDNFVGLFPNRPQIVEMVNQSHRSKLLPQDTLANLYFSVGRYVVSDRSLPVSAIYDRAYIAKQSVKGRYDQHIAYFSESMLEALTREQRIISQMGEALEQRQFEVWFQPQYNHSSGALIGAEALVRWRHPSMGLVPPGDFIPVFERCGFVYELDKYVWEESCRCLQKWREAGRNPLPVSVNISRYDIFRPDLTKVLTELMEKYQLPVELLRLEITESAFATSGEQIVQIVKELIGYGFTIEIDDFGSGYSSLNTLKNVPAQIVKLDMRFLEDDEDSDRGGNILESIVRMSKWLDMSVIAEGVETVEQANFLKSIGCSYVQGYLYARPMPEADYEALARDLGGEQRLLALKTVENLDNNAFWNPGSMDTLIFNSYVGGACIFEYHQGNIELLRVNDKFSDILGSGVLTADDILRLDWLGCLTDESRAAVRRVLQRSIDTGEELTEEYVFTGIPGCPEKTYLRSTMRVIASAEDRYLVYCSSENITAQREAERRELAVAEQMRLIMQNVHGGICAYAFQEGGSLQLLFASDTFYSMRGYTKEQFENELGNIMDAVHPDDRAKTLAIMDRMVHERGSATYEYRCFKRDGSIMHVRCSNSVTSFSGVSDTVLLSVTADITDLFMAEQKERALSQQLQAVMDNVGLGITATIIRDGNASFLFSNNRYYEILGYTREQYALEVENPYWTVCPEDRPRLVEQTAQINRTGKAADLEFRAIRRDKSLIWLRTTITTGSFAGVQETVQLSMFRDISKEKQAAAAIQTLMDDTPGGFCRMRICSGRPPQMEYCNGGFAELVSMNREEAMAFFSADPLGGIHPDDCPGMLAASENAAQTGGQFSARCRLRRGKDGYIWVQLSGRFVKDAAGETHLNAYYADVSQQVETEDRQRKLLDNLPCGAALFSYDGEHLFIDHFNRRYMELAGRQFDGSQKVSALDAVHPDDRSLLTLELQTAIRQHRDGACDIRIHSDSGVYQPFHVAASFTHHPDGKCSVFATYTLITDRTMSIQEMLPVALDAMMSSSTDFSFVKDKDLRYVCCSRSMAQLVGLANAKDVIGKSDLDLFSTQLADQFVNDDRALMESGESVVDRIEALPSDDGATRYVSTSKYLLRDSLGSTVGLYGMSRDVTATLEKDSQLKLLTDSIPGGIATYEGSPEALDRIRLIYFSDGFCKMFGYTREEYRAICAKNPLSLVLKEDVPDMMAQIRALVHENKPMDCVYRARVNGGGLKWINIKALVGRRGDRAMTVNAVSFDVTERQDAMERLRISEETNRLAMQHTGHKICKFNVADQSLSLPEISPLFSLSNRIENVPQGPVSKGEISAETADAYTAFYQGILRGDPTGSVMFQRVSKEGWRWLEAHYTTIFSADGKPVWAVISYTDVTEQIKKETVYKRWQQSMEGKNPQDYTLFRSNITKDAAFDTVEGSLLQFVFSDRAKTFNDRTLEYAQQQVWPEDRERYIAFLNSDAMLANYYRGKRCDALEYREALPGGGVRWLRLSMNLVEYPNSTDVEAYLMYESIDDIKRAELTAIERAESDPLTGVLNRTAFISKVDQLLKSSSPGVKHALLMLDMDGFKRVNDTFGHGAGDEMLMNITHSLGSVLRKGDLLGRLGGDEFVIFLSDIPSDATAANKAKQVCALTRKAFSLEIQVSASVGIVVSPRDGASFEALYKKADSALYYVKGAGKDSFAFYREDMDGRHPMANEPEADGQSAQKQRMKRRMLIVSNSRTDLALMSKLFGEEFLIEQARDGNSALIKLRHYGSAVSVVLLDLMLPGMDGFTVLKRIQASGEMRCVPVIVVSGGEDRETGLRAIQGGAADFVNKPVDPDVLRIRVHSAVSKAENERLRAQNSFLELRGDETLRYRTALESVGASVIEHNWLDGSFVYDPSICAHLAGCYDGRTLWRILLADMVADTVTVQKIQALVLDVAQDRSKTSGSMTALLKTPSNAKHRFRINVCKLKNSYALTNKLIITLTDLEQEEPA